MADKRRVHHGDLRRSLLADAALLLEAGAPEALSLRALARRAGVSPRAPYRHFADREALLVALAAKGFEALGDALAAADATAEPGRQLEAQGIAFVRFALAAPERFRLMFGPRRPAVDDELADAKRGAFGLLVGAVERVSGLGDDVPARAVGYWSLAHGLATLFLDGRVHDEIDGADDEIIRRVAAATLRFVIPTEGE